MARAKTRAKAKADPGVQRFMGLGLGGLGFRGLGLGSRVRVFGVEEYDLWCVWVVLGRIFASSEPGCSMERVQFGYCPHSVTAG